MKEEKDKFKVKRKTIYVIGLIATVLIISLLFYSTMQASPTWKIYGSKINYSNEYSRIEVTPHTSTNSAEHCFEPEVTSYFEGNVNLSIALVFDYTLTIDKVWIWDFWSETIYCDYYINGTCEHPCEDQYNDDSCKLIREEEGYVNVIDGLKHQEHGEKHYYYIKTKKKDTYDTVRTKWCFDTPSDKPNSKLEVFVKNAEDSIGRALEQGTYTAIDPWWFAETEGKECNICGEKIACWDKRDGTAYNRASEWKCTCRSGESCVEYNLYTEREEYRREDFEHININLN